MYFKIGNVELAERSDVSYLFSFPAKVVVIDGHLETEEYCATVGLVVSAENVEKMKPDCVNMSLRPSQHYIQWHETEVCISNEERKRLALHVENSLAELMTEIQAFAVGNLK